MVINRELYEAEKLAAHVNGLLEAAALVNTTNQSGHLSAPGMQHRIWQRLMVRVKELQAESTICNNGLERS